MRTCLVLIACVCLSASLSAGLALADTPAGRAPSATVSAGDTLRAAAPTVVPAVPSRNPIMAEVRAAFDREREQIAALRARLQQQPDHQAALALQREIEKVKLDTEVAILRIQAGAAREAGHAALAERLEAAAKDLLDPAGGHDPGHASGAPRHRPLTGARTRLPWTARAESAWRPSCSAC